MKRLILTIVAVIVCLGLRAGNTTTDIESWFGSESAGSIFPNLDKNARLDMLDYFKSGMDTPSTESFYKAPVNISRLDGNMMQLKSDGLTTDIYIFGKGDNAIIAVVENIPLGAGDSVVKVYNFDGTPNAKAFVMPEYADWLVKDALKTVPAGLLTSEIPYVTATATVDPAAGRITLTNTAITVPGVDATVAKVFKPELVYDYKKGVFRAGR